MPNRFEQALRIDADRVCEPPVERIGVKPLAQEREHDRTCSQPDGDAPARRERPAVREEDEEDRAERRTRARCSTRRATRATCGAGTASGRTAAISAPISTMPFDCPDERRAAHDPADGVLGPASGDERAGRREHGEPEVTEDREPERLEVRLLHRGRAVDGESDPEPGEGRGTGAQRNQARRVVVRVLTFVCPATVTRPRPVRAATSPARRLGAHR